MGKHAASDQKNYGVPGARNIEQQGKGKIAARRQSTGQRAAHYSLHAPLTCDAAGAKSSGAKTTPMGRGNTDLGSAVN